MAHMMEAANRCGCKRSWGLGFGVNQRPPIHEDTPNIILWRQTALKRYIGGCEVSGVFMFRASGSKFEACATARPLLPELGVLCRISSIGSEAGVVSHSFL